MSDENIKTSGSSVPMERPGQPVEVATCFVFLASPDSSYSRYATCTLGTLVSHDDLFALADKSCTSMEVL